MKKISSKIFLIVFTCSVASVLILVSISIWKTSAIVRTDEEEILQWMVRDYADKFSQELSVIEDKLVELEAHLINTIDYEALKSDANYLASYETQLAPVVKKFAEDRTKSVAGWVYFDPKWSNTPHDVYYVDGNDDAIAERQAYIPFSYYDNIPIENDDKQWWYGPKETKKTFWTNPYEWTLVNGDIIKVVSCARPVYIEDEFIGVVGTYYRFDAMQEEIQNIKVYDTGYATLFNEKLDVVIHPEYIGGTRFTSENLHSVKEGMYKEMALQMEKKDYGIIYNEGKYIFAYAKLSNGWIMGLKPYTNEMYAGFYDLILYLIGSVVFCIVFSFFAAYLLGQYITKPILKVVESAGIMGTGDLSIRVESNTKDEVKILADSLNSMSDNIKSLQNDLIQQAYYDDLTHARNLRKFKIDAEELLKINRDKTYMLVKLDVDKFKLVNELYGFSEGDKILKNITKALEEVIDSKYDIFARVNADDFVVFTHVSNKSVFEANLKKFKAHFASFNEGVLNYKITFPIGRYVVKKDEYDITSMFEKVNLAHRLAKQDTEHKVCEYDETLRIQAIYENEVENKMEDALKNGEFMLYLQPKYGLDVEKVVGAESLVRWINCNSDMVYPGVFIPLFERNGFITKLDMYMFEKTCMCIRSWIDAGIEPVSVSVNFSRLHLNNPDFVQVLCSIVDSYRIPRKYLELEITETAIFNDLETFIQFSEEMHLAGFTLSMDDFGTGYSSLGLLKNLPIDVIKIDRSFFIDAIDEERSLVIIETIIEMTKKLGIYTVAEGVEEKKYVDLLKQLHCDAIQGYYYAKPMPADQFTKSINQEK